jgi:hypothetical protein
MRAIEVLQELENMSRIYLHNTDASILDNYTAALNRVEGNMATVNGFGKLSSEFMDAERLHKDLESWYIHLRNQRDQEE